MAEILDALKKAESFISGFDGDESQDDMSVLDDVRQAIAFLERPRPKQQIHNLAVILEGGIVQYIVSDTLDTANCKAIVIDHDTDGMEAESLHQLKFDNGQTQGVLVNAPGICLPDFPLADICIEMCDAE